MAVAGSIRAWCFLALVVLWVVGCNSTSELLDIDSRYSESLSVVSREYEFAARTNAATTVQVVQVYAQGPKGNVSLLDATRGRLLYESRSSSEIMALFATLQSRESSGRCELGDDPAFVVVAYDRDLPRVGIIRLYKCDADGRAVIGIRPVGDAALGYSSVAVGYLREIGVWQ